MYIFTDVYCSECLVLFIRGVVEISQRIGIEIEAHVFG